MFAMPARLISEANDADMKTRWKWQWLQTGGAAVYRSGATETSRNIWVQHCRFSCPIEKMTMSQL